MWTWWSYFRCFNHVKSWCVLKDEILATQQVNDAILSGVENEEQINFKNI